MGYMVGLNEETEGSCICPHCGSELTHIDLYGLVFMCPECGEYIELARDNKPLECGATIKIISEE